MISLFEVGKDYAGDEMGWPQLILKCVWVSEQTGYAVLRDIANSEEYLVRNSASLHPVYVFDPTNQGSGNSTPSFPNTPRKPYQYNEYKDPTEKRNKNLRELLFKRFGIKK